MHEHLNLTVEISSAHHSNIVESNNPSNNSKKNNLARYIEIIIYHYKHLLNIYETNCIK